MCAFAQLLDSFALDSFHVCLFLFRSCSKGVAAPAGAFFDVESGTNNGGLGSGFEATSGWDPATGCGTPNYPALRALVMG